MAPRHILRMWLSTAKRTKALIGGVAYQRFKAQSDSLRIRRYAASRLRLFEELVINKSMVL
jgi:hypothetical protein